MPQKQLRLQICTPERTVLDQKADFVLLRTTQGDMGILYGHEPAIVALDAGLLRSYENKQESSTYAVMGGFVSVRDNEITVMTSMAELPDRIEEALAEMERRRAENKKYEQVADFEMHRAEKALRRMLVRMEISSYSIIKGKDGASG